MNRATRRRQGIIVSAIGAAILVPLVALPASASLDDGHFLVHAQNIEEPEYEAYAGLKSDGSAPGGGEVDPGGDESSATLASYSCGPLGFAVTQAMVDFSKANQALAAEGKAPQTNAEGWQSMAYFSATERKMIAGYPEDGSVPPLVYLKSDMALPVPSDQPGPTNGVLLRLDNSANCSYLDARSGAAEGKGFGYWMLSNGAFSESRYLREDGALVAVSSARQADGANTISRKESAVSYNPAKSNSKPYSLSKSQAGVVRAELILKETIDGYNRITVTANPDGSGSISYSNYLGANSATSLKIGAPNRTQGPTGIIWNSEGEITGLEGGKPGSTVFWRGGPFTVEEYNEATGMNWDGSYQKPSDFDLNFPFAPTPPSL